MKKISILLLLVVAAMTMKAASGFVRGADISWCTEMEADGKKFYDANGVQTDIFKLMKSIGMKAIRLRVWVNPSSYGYGAWCDKADVLAKAKRANEQGLDVLIDFHYSDFFADPSTQTCPVDWQSYSASQVKTALVNHTKDVLQALKDEGIEPKWAQVGNETNNGMVGDFGAIDWNKSGSAQYTNYVTLSNAGYDAVKAVFPNATVIVHFANAYSLADYNCWLPTAFKDAGGKFDMLGVSHYPDASKWNSTSSGTVSNYNAAQAVKTLGNTFGVQVMIVETGISSSSESVAERAMTDLFERVEDLSQCAGIFYWEPEVYGNWRPSYYKTLGWNAYDKGAFTSAGRPSAALNPFKSDDDEEEEETTTYPATLSVYSQDGTTVLTTLTLTDAQQGIYTGKLNVTEAWQNFHIVDTETDTWYGSDPSDKTALSTAEGKWNLWIDSEVTGLYEITANLSAMTWSHVYRGTSTSILEAPGNANNAPVEYYDMTGRKVDAAARGILIRKQGTAVTKVINFSNH